MSLDFYSIQDPNTNFTRITFDDLQTFCAIHGIKVEKKDNSIVFPIQWDLFKDLLKTKLHGPLKFVKLTNSSQYDISLEYQKIGTTTILLDDNKFNYLGADATQLPGDSVIKVIFTPKADIKAISKTTEGFFMDTCNCEAVQTYYRILFIVGAILIIYLLYYVYINKNK
jgi:hypothetical protein